MVAPEIDFFGYSAPLRELFFFYSHKNSVIVYVKDAFMMW